MSPYCLVTSAMLNVVTASYQDMGGHFLSGSALFSLTASECLMRNSLSWSPHGLAQAIAREANPLQGTL